MSENKKTALETYNLEYPLNLILAIAECGEDELKFEITRDTYLALAYILTTLSPREERVLELRYKERWTRAKIGEEFCLSDSRAAQLEHRALRKLRHPGRFYILRSGLIGWKNQQCEAEYKRGLEEGKELGYRKCLDDLKKGKTTEGFNVDILSKSFDELNISMRSKNAMIAKGYRTVGDIIHLYEDEILHIRNFGQKSICEVACVLNSLGIIGTAWDEFC